LIRSNKGQTMTQTDQKKDQSLDQDRSQQNQEVIPKDKEKRKLQRLRAKKQRELKRLATALEPHPNCKYKPKYPEMLIEHMTNGYSLESFCGELSISFETLQRWAERYPEMHEAKKIGTYKSLLFWEKVGIKGALGLLKDFNSTAWIFNMKCRFHKQGWQDKKKLETTSTFEIKGITQEQIQEAVKKDKFLQVIETENINE